MPGVGSNEAQEVTQELQKVSRTISTETSQLVDAIANLELDLEDAKRTNIRLTIQEKLLSAEVDDKTSTISKLNEELSMETKKREIAESEVKKIMEDLTKLSAEFKALQRDGSPRDGASSPRDGLVQVSHIVSFPIILLRSANSRCGDAGGDHQAPRRSGEQSPLPLGDEAL